MGAMIEIVDDCHHPAGLPLKWFDDLGANLLSAEGIKAMSRMELAWLKSCVLLLGGVASCPRLESLRTHGGACALTPKPHLNGLESGCGATQSLGRRRLGR